MSETGNPTMSTNPRPIANSNDEFLFGNIEAWIKIIQSYEVKHPDHRVLISYRGEPVNDLISLFKQTMKPGDEDFKLVVATPDDNTKDVPKLYRLLVEGASPNFERFIQREAFKVLDLF